MSTWLGLLVIIVFATAVWLYIAAIWAVYWVFHHHFEFPYFVSLVLAWLFVSTLCGISRFVMVKP